jgi:hypothetical protein
MNEREKGKANRAHGRRAHAAIILSLLAPVVGHGPSSKRARYSAMSDTGANAVTSDPDQSTSSQPIEPISSLNITFKYHAVPSRDCSYWTGQV